MAGSIWRVAFDEEMDRSRRDLERRYRDAMGSWVRDLRRWDLFARSATFDPLDLAAATRNRESLSSEHLQMDKQTRSRLLVPALTFATARRHLEYFADTATRVVERPVYVVGVVEPHRSGQPHAHFVASIEGGLTHGDIRRLHTLWRASRGNGSIYLVPPKSPGDVAGYCAKYLAKDASELVMSRNLRRASALVGAGG